MREAACGCQIIEVEKGHKQILHVIGCNNPSLEFINNELVIVVKENLWGKR